MAEISLTSAEGATPPLFGTRFGVTLLTTTLTPTDHAKKVDKWLKRKNGGRGCFRFKFLPAYAPELNPVERLNNVLKNEIKKTECRSSKDVVDVAERALNKFINKASMDKSTVTNLFLDKDCSYSKIVHDKIMGDLPQKATNVA